MNPSWTQRLRQTMWRHVGIVGTRDGLATAAAELDALEAAFEREVAYQGRNAPAIGFRNMLTVAQLVTRSAHQRCESRGLHFNADCPSTAADASDTALRPI